MLLISNIFYLYDRKLYVSTYKESYLVYCSRKIHVLVYLYIIIGLDNFNQRVEILHKSVRHLDLVCARSGSRDCRVQHQSALHCFAL